MLKRLLLSCCCCFILCGALPNFVGVAQATQSHNVMEGFANNEADERIQASLKEKHQILFFMGILLLIGIFATAILGIAMAVYGKQVFVFHMVCAGFSVFLATAHAVTAMVWFYPF